MPLITIAAASPDRQISTKARIAAEISRLSSNLLHKDPKVTAVIVTSVDPDDWFLRRALAHRRRPGELLA